jgi:hypothetical protein
VDTDLPQVHYMQEIEVDNRPTSKYFYWQAGHSESTADKHYSSSFNRPIGIQTRDLRCFNICSLAWHRLFSFDRRGFNLEGFEASMGTILGTKRVVEKILVPDQKSTQKQSCKVRL